MSTCLAGWKRINEINTRTQFWLKECLKSNKFVENVWLCDFNCGDRRIVQLNTSSVGSMSNAVQMSSLDGAEEVMFCSSSFWLFLAYHIEQPARQLRPKKKSFQSFLGKLLLDMEMKIPYGTATFPPLLKILSLDNLVSFSHEINDCAATPCSLSPFWRELLLTTCLYLLTLAMCFCNGLSKCYPMWSCLYRLPVTYHFPFVLQSHLCIWTPVCSLVFVLVWF